MIGGPFRFYMLVKSPDGQGGVTESAIPVGTYFGTLVVHGNTTAINIDVDEIAEINDIVEGTDGAFYRVTGRERMTEHRRQVIIVERIARPICIPGTLT